MANEETSGTKEQVAGYARVICRTHGAVEISEAQYWDEMNRPDSRWKCPTCGAVARFDDDFYESQHLTPIPTMKLDAAKALLSPCKRYEHALPDDVVVDGNAVWIDAEGDVVADATFGGGCDSVVIDEMYEFSGEEALALKLLGTLSTNLGELDEETRKRLTTGVQTRAELEAMQTERIDAALEGSGLEFVRVETFEKLQYHHEEPRYPDFPCFLYLYDSQGFHSGKVPLEDRRQLEAAMAGGIRVNMSKKLEVKITDIGDFLMFHAKDGKVLYPPVGQSITRAGAQ